MLITENVIVKFGLNALVGQSGGPTAAINATLCGVIRGCHGKFDTLYGMKNGIEGLLQEELVNLNFLFGDEASLSSLSTTPSAVLGSCRQRLPKDFSDSVYEKIFDILDKYSIGAVFYIGGNDSMDTVHKLSQYAKVHSLGVSFVGVPKTIDNDLVLTDHTPGYGSSAKYIATTVGEIFRDVSVYRAPSVTVVEVMGRGAGWLGCACALPTALGSGGCHLVYLPELGISLDTILSDIESFLCKSPTLLIGLSEGALPSDAGAKDSFGHTRASGGGRLIEAAVYKYLGCKSRSVEINLPQRCASHLMSGTDLSESLLIGQEAVNLACEGKSGVMASFRRRAGEYGVDVVSVDAGLVANSVKKVPAHFIDKKNRFVTKECIDYLAPLIMGETQIEYKRGLPHYFNLR